MPAPWAALAQLRIVGEIHGQQTINVLHFATNLQGLDNPNELDNRLRALAQAMLECVQQFLLPATTQDWHVVQVDAKQLLPQLGDPVVVSPVGATVGTLSKASASFLASLISVRTGGGGKSGRGRMYLPPAGEAETADSALDDPTLVLLAAFIACVVTKFLGNQPDENWNLGVLSTKKLKAQPANIDNAFRMATSLVASKDVKRMTSRQKGSGS